MEERKIGFFDKYLTLWVLLCIVAGIAVGKFLPVIPQTLSQFEYAHVSIPVAILIWVMIYPMMMKVDFHSVSAAPCTAMVFIWSYLSDGNPAYTLVQVAVNDLIILVAFAPIVALLLGVGGVQIPYDTLLLSVVLFVVLPLVAGIITRTTVVRRKGKEYFEQVFVHKFDRYTTAGLLLTLVILFSFQGETILSNPLHIVLIAVPLILQTYLIFAVAYGWAKAWRLPYDIAAPAGMIGASNFFELAVAVAISLFGLRSGAALATTVGVLTEVPIMLSLVRIAKSTKSKFAG